MSIRIKVLTGFFLIFTGTLLAGGLVLYSLVKQNLREDIESGLFSNSSVLMEMVHSAVNVSVRNHLRAVAEKNCEIVAHFHDEARKGRMTEAEAKRRATEVLLAQHIGTTGYIYCLNSAGVVQVHPVASNVGRDVSGFAFVRQQKERRSGYLEYNWSNPGDNVPRPKALYMAYYKPWDWIISASTYREEFHKLVELDDFRRSITTQRFGRDGYAFVLDSAGNIIMHPHLSGNIVGLRDANGLPLIREIVARKFGKLYYWWRNPGESEPRQKIVTFNYLPEVGWIVCSSAYVEDFSAPLQYLRNVAVGAFVAMLLLGLPFSWWVGNSVTSSLRELASGFSRATEGDFSIRLAEDGVGEMGRITEYFNAFMAKLEDYDNSLRREIKDRRNAVRGEKRASAGGHRLAARHRHGCGPGKPRHPLEPPGRGGPGREPRGRAGPTGDGHLPHVRHVPRPGGDCRARAAVHGLGQSGGRARRAHGVPRHGGLAPGRGRGGGRRHQRRHPPRAGRGHDGPEREDALRGWPGRGHGP